MVRRGCLTLLLVAGLVFTARPSVAQWLRLDPYTPRFLQINETNPYQIAAYGSVAPDPTWPSPPDQIADLVQHGSTYARLWNFWTVGGGGPYTLTSCQPADPPGTEAGSYPDLNSFNGAGGTGLQSYWGRQRASAIAAWNSGDPLLTLEVMLFKKQEWTEPRLQTNPFYKNCSGISLTIEHFEKLPRAVHPNKYDVDGNWSFTWPPENCPSLAPEPKALCYLQAYVRQVLDDTHDYGNLVYEVMNEPVDDSGAPGSITWDDVHYFQKYWAAYVKWYLVTIKGWQPRLVHAAKKTLPAGWDLHPLWNENFNKIDTVNYHPGNTSGDSEMQFFPKVDVSQDYTGFAKTLDVDEFGNGETRPWALRKQAWTTVATGGNFHIEDPWPDAQPWQPVQSIAAFKKRTAWRFDRGKPLSVCTAAPCFFWMQHGQGAFDQDPVSHATGWDLFGVMDHVGYLALNNHVCSPSTPLNADLPATPGGATEYVARVWNPQADPPDFFKDALGKVREHRFLWSSGGAYNWCTQFSDLITTAGASDHNEDRVFLVRATRPSGTAVLHALANACPLSLPTFVAGEDRVVQLSGVCGVPVGAKAVTMMIAVAPTSVGSLNVHLPGTDPASTSVVNFVANRTLASNGHFLLNPQGQLAVANNQQTGSTALTINVTGFFQ